jgi:DNA-binding NarL/FixJ family response regulator
MRVLLADVQAHIRSSLQMLLKREQGVAVVGEVSEATDLVTQIGTTHPDLVLLDWELPGLTTIGSLPGLHRICPNLLVIVLSGRPEAKRDALAAGADAFVSKADPPERLLATLHDMNNRSKRQETQIVQFSREVKAG